MKNRLALIIVSSLLILSCNSNKPFHEIKVDNPQFIPNTAFGSFEDLSSPKFKGLKEKYQLDTIFHGEKDELVSPKQSQLLSAWLKLAGIPNELVIVKDAPHFGVMFDSDEIRLKS